VGLKKQEQELISGGAVTGKSPKRKQWDAKPSHKVIHTVLTVLATLLIIGGGAYAYYFFTHETETTISNNPGPILRSTVSGLNPSTVKFDETAYSMQLPNDWKRLTPDTNGPYKKYAYQSNKKNAENRWLYVYVDGLPRDMPVNKAIRVESEGESLTHGEISTQCIDFTADTKVLKAPAKWDGSTSSVIWTPGPGTSSVPARREISTK
jgi:hypothetical protein